jgi:hypothetical protein
LHEVWHGFSVTRGARYTAVPNCWPFESGHQVPILRPRKLLVLKTMVVTVAKSGTRSSMVEKYERKRSTAQVLKAKGDVKTGPSSQSWMPEMVRA